MDYPHCQQQQQQQLKAQRNVTYIIHGTAVSFRRAPLLDEGSVGVEHDGAAAKGSPQKLMFRSFNMRHIAAGGSAVIFRCCRVC